MELRLHGVPTHKRKLRLGATKLLLLFTLLLRHLCLLFFVIDYIFNVLINRLIFIDPWGFGVLEENFFDMSFDYPWWKFRNLNFMLVNTTIDYRAEPLLTIDDS